MCTNLNQLRKVTSVRLRNIFATQKVRSYVCLIFLAGSFSLSACMNTAIQDEHDSNLHAFTPEQSQSATSQPSDFASYWEQTKHLPPAATDEEYQQSFMQSAQKYADCIEKHGWPRPTIENPYTPFVNIAEEVTPVGQEAEKFEDEKDCLDEAAPWPTHPQLTQETLSAEYDRLEQFRSCISQNGGELSELPTREKYIQDVLTGGEGWIPMVELRKKGFWSDKTQDQIFQLCPW